MTPPPPPPTPALPPPDALAPVAAAPEALVVSGGWQIEGLPATIRRAGPQAAERTVEFFTAQIRNPHTRAAYGTAVTRFFTWCDARGLALEQISPIAVATYIDEMHGRYRAPTIKQHLAAIRRLFDWLVIGQVVPANPAASVRGPTHVVRTGKTPVLQPAEARQLFRRDRRTPCVGVQAGEPARHRSQRFVRQRANRAERMVGWHALFRRQVAEHVSALLIVSAHDGAPFSGVGSMVVRRDRSVDPISRSFSAAC